MSGDSAEALAALEAARSALREAEARYSAALAADDLVTRVAFLLFQHETKAEEEWGPDPVTWAHWETLQIEEQRDDWRRLAVAILNEVVDEIEAHRG